MPNLSMRLAHVVVSLLVTLSACTSFPQPDVPAKPQLAEYLKQATVTVETGAGGLCSGVWIAKHLILTANHCVADMEDGESLAVSTPSNHDAGGTPAVVMALDEVHDLAVVGVMEVPDHPITMPGALPQQGDRVETMGHPVGQYWSYSSGDVAAIRDDLDGGPFRVIQTTAPTSPGNSGGGLFNERGELVGICSYKVVRRGAENLSYYIPVQYAASLLF